MTPGWKIWSICHQFIAAPPAISYTGYSCGFLQR
jgi:hypothetical protein